MKLTSPWLQYMSYKLCGIEPEAIQSIKKLVDPTEAVGLTDAQRAVYAYALELDTTSRVNDDTHAAALEAVS